MLMALTKGKLSRHQENMEDILTSNVFGLLKYLPPNEGLLPFLRLAEESDGRLPLEDLPDDIRVEYEFWPWHEEKGCIGCQPDVFLRFTKSDGSRVNVLIEAKYRSGKSSEEDDTREAPVDQLAREWDNLRRLSDREGALPLLIYLTADVACPVADIRASQTEYHRKRREEGDLFACAWLSWRRLSQIFPSTSSEILRDLADMAERLHLAYFKGVSDLGVSEALGWRFIPEQRRFNWMSIPRRPDWRFGQ